MSIKFSRNIEDFSCEHCGETVKGDGYTNHCPACLWSKHVDIFPGDRASDCTGMMEPIGVEQKSGKYRLIHKCTICGHIQRNKSSTKDDFDKLLEIMRNASWNLGRGQ